MGSRVFCVNVFLAPAPPKDSEKSFHDIFQKIATTGSPTDSCQLLVQLAPVHSRLSMRGLNTNTFELLKHCVTLRGGLLLAVNPTTKLHFTPKWMNIIKSFHYHKVTEECKTQSRTSLVVQWLRICLLIQGTQTKITHALGQLSPLRCNWNPVQSWRRRS